MGPPLRTGTARGSREIRGSRAVPNRQRPPGGGGSAAADCEQTWKIHEPPRYQRPGGWWMRLLSVYLPIYREPVYSAGIISHDGGSGGRYAISLASGRTTLLSERSKRNPRT